MPRRHSLPILLSVAVWLTACTGLLSGGSGTGNPPLAEVALQVRAAETGSLGKRSADGLPLLLQDSMGNPITLTAVRVKVEQIDFELPLGRTCDQVRGVDCEDSDIVVPRNFTMDLADGTLEPALAPFRIPAWTYRDIGLEPTGASEPKAPGDSGNILLSGWMGPDTAAGRRFALELHLSDGLDFSNPIGVTLQADTLNHLLLTMKTDGWFSGVDLGACLDGGEATADSSGVLRLRGADFCQGAGRNIAGKITSSGEFDEDGDE